jgi:2',3'-cyclic-nucleotide 2'-phosphodiesterase (5'-nucleotidase family)
MIASLYVHIKNHIYYITTKETLKRYFVIPNTYDYVIIPLQKRGKHMKKTINLMMMILMLITLIACTTPQSQTNIDIDQPYFLVAEDIIYYIGDDAPNYLEGIIAKNHLDEDISDLISYDASAVDLETPGSYMVLYEVTDLNGQKQSMYIYIVVLPVPVDEVDIFAPIIYGLDDITYYINHLPPDYLDGVSAMDDVDGNLTNEINVDISEVDLETVGSYDITYRVTDISGNQTVEIRKIHVAIEHIDHLNIYYINDVHGAILEDTNQIGMAKMANLILDDKTHKPNNTLFISGGDILQGNILSNYTYGASFIDILNHMKHDAFTLGNHEFDWGLEVVTEFFNPETEGIKAQFPALGANIFFKGTTEIPPFIAPYTIIEKGHIKVGIIGVMGYGLESSIATSRIRDYEFGEPLKEIRHYTKHLRDEKDVDVVLVMIHGSDDGLNQQIGSLSGSEYVDAVFNGHSHQTYVRTVGRSGVDMPVIQSGGNGSNLGWVHLHFLEKDVVAYSAFNINRGNDARLQTEHPEIKDLINQYVSDIAPLLNDSIIYAGSFISRSALTLYMAKLMQMATDSDIAFHNSGGTRADIQNGQAITVATLYQIFPFDNRIKTVTLKGDDIIYYMDRYGNYSLREGLTEIDPDQYYKVATNDYLFDQEDEPFIYGTNIDDTGIYIRDLMQEVLEEIAKTHEYFTVDIPIPLQTFLPPVLISQDTILTNAIRERFLIAFLFDYRNISVYIHIYK